MLQVHDGQCGLCLHFGEHHAKDAKLIQIRTTQKAPESLLDDCASQACRPSFEGHCHQRL